MSLHAERVWANAIDSKAHIDLPGDPPKITITPDHKMPNTIYAQINKEDHTIANLLRMKLNEDENVVFAAYQIPHPTEAVVQMKIQTVAPDVYGAGANLGDSTEEPRMALSRATRRALNDVEEFSALFERAMEQ